MTETATETLSIAPGQTVYLVEALDPDDPASGTVYAYALATDAQIDGGRLTVLAGETVLDTFAPDEWGFVGRVHLAPGQYLTQRDGSAVMGLAAERPADRPPRKLRGGSKCWYQ